MVSNQVLGARLAAGVLIASMICGCAHTRSSSEAAAPAPAAAASEATAAPAPPEMTATEAAISAAGTSAAAAPITSAEVQPNAPMHYTVKPGDTLWGIASMYLKDPWLWPEVWVINPQVANPHLIYPGDTLALVYGAGGRPQVTLERAGSVRLDPRLRSAPLDGSIPTIPYAAIAAFLSRPTVMTSEEIRRAPYVLAFRDMHETAGAGNEVYIRNLGAGANENARFAVIHIAGPLRDPDDGKVVGYEGIYTATALVRRPGDPAKALLIDPARETLRGDRLLSSDTSETPANFVPHAPANNIRGRILDVIAGTAVVGTYDVVVINRGKRHGIEPGNVLHVESEGDVVQDIFRNGHEIGNNAPFAPHVKLPDERSGTVLVFKVFDRVSYALVVGAADVMYVGDLVTSPNPS
jgi:LysM repeat protein